MRLKGIYKGRHSVIKTLQIGERSRIWSYVNIMSGAIIGADCNICDRCFVESGAIVGNRVTIKTGVSLWLGVVIMDDVFIGPGVSFCNDSYPRSRKYKEPEMTIVEEGCSIGAGAVILPSIKIGKGSIVGAGSVVTKSVAPHTVVAGNPARVIRLLDQ